MITRQIVKKISNPLLTFLIALYLMGPQAVAHEPEPQIKSGKAKRHQMNHPIPDFSLTDQKEEPFSFVKLRGKWILVSFMYSTCPDICPLTTISLRQVQIGLRTRERKAVYILSITTDPEIDSPRVLKSYAERYRVDFSNWSFLTGETKSLALVWKAFGIKVKRKARGLIDHTTISALVDEKGIMRFVYYGTSPESKVILNDLRSLLTKRPN